MALPHRTAAAARAPKGVPPKQEKQQINTGQATQEQAATPMPRHRMAGSTRDGEYITEHHRGRRKS